MFETELLSSTKESKGKTLISNIRKKPFLNHGNKQNTLALVLLAAVICLFQLTYMQYVAPPQMGWWQYYGWRLNQGDLLYKDIYLFLQPYFVWLMGGLYHVFGSHFFYYQILGLVMRIAEASLVFLLLRRFLNTPLSLLFSFCGVVLTAAYLTDFCFDYNQILRFFVVVTAYSSVCAWETSNRKKRLWILLLVGFVCGLHVMCKQTGIVVFFAVLLGLFVVFWKTEDFKSSLRNLLFILIGFLIACIPGYLYLFYTHTFPSYVQCMSIAAESKGGMTNVLSRIIKYQFYWQEFVIAIVFVIYYYFSQKKQYYLRVVGDASEKAYSYVIMLLVSAAIILIVIRMNNLGMYTPLSISMFAKAIVASIIIVTICGVAWFLLYKKFTLSKEKETLILILFFVLLVCAICFVQRYNYIVKYSVFDNHIATGLIRIIVNVSFWAALIIFIIQTVELIRTKNVVPSVSFYIFLGIALTFPLIGLLSATVEELYMLPLFPLLLLLAVKLKTEFPVVKYGFIAILCFSLLFLVISVKQIEPYQWHGWAMDSIIAPDVDHCDNSINGLEYYSLSIQDEKAYEKIIALIEKQTTPDDTVYQFPSMMLFNVLAQRQTGTYAPVHYFDVAPDEIASADAEQLAKNPPKMVIWSKLSEDTWKLHESYFRNGHQSGQRDIQNFYENYVKDNYKLAYQYKSLYVWVRDETILEKDDHSEAKD
ncbi:Dolichyl-phosphate-mannose-protein mannosyltransferase [anaerobic digester metagenome]